MDSITICNLALNVIGSPNITSFDENSASAKLCAQFYPIIRDRVLRDHAWSFATCRAELAQLDETPVDPAYHYVYSLPGDCITALYLAPGDYPYRRQGNRLLTNQRPATLIYTSRVQDPNLFDETFVQALQYLLAAEIGYASMRDDNTIARLQQQYQQALMQARSRDSQENRFASQPARPRSPWLAARGSAYGEIHDTGLPLHFVEGTAGKQGN